MTKPIVELQAEEDVVFEDGKELMKYINALCANIADKKIRRKTKKDFLFKLRSEYGAIV
jgi:hypothetical protein